jgi:hypothetical protein
MKIWKWTPQDILVIQIAGLGTYRFATLMQEYLELRHNVDFRTFGFGTVEMVERFIYAYSRPQLLITGTISSNYQETYDLVQRMRTKNRQLVVVLYSSKEIDPKYFDRIVNKARSTSTDELVDAIRSFRGGALRRNPE